MKSYINGAACISVQATFLADTFLEGALPVAADEVCYAAEPSYKEYIAPNASRRMAKGVKMGIATAAEALKEANLTTPEAIFVGTGMGCVQDSEKFLTALLDNNEAHLTPTAFIQSTHNTVGGQIALLLQCKGENLTYVNGAVSFESALLAARMQMEQETVGTALVGGVDEHSPHTVFLHDLVGLNQKGEGAAFFALSGEESATTYGQLVDVALYNELTGDEQEMMLHSFLFRNELTLADIDLVLTGEATPPNWGRPTYAYKNLSGEYYTASAFGFWLACQVLRCQRIPSVAGLPVSSPIRHILLVNSYLGKDFSFVLLKK
ncbi:beta-ketoacyl synthase N-terminal-like domain-containing protein [Capnocytophaga sp. oral taxon 878]|uniref:beta-ketoacyl synthase N-terminal-like domain-containing protein n=1 Tax=Capnocytophaga sp. oral taxon 878 TaxID=1316596 RepID=UPI000D03F9B0|nr:beta-ketoacyl synthase N-terminal-like domain-containing protein [Capnocytophaga sp. oral taxon 878]AVM50047.1 beta-ketoacyl synthase [Capnocytophaga sp. oral taxon 878]